MGLRDWLAKRRETPRAAGPADGPADPVGVMTQIVQADRLAADDGWVVFEASCPGGRARAEVSGDTVNFCLVEVDLPALLREVGLATLAESVKPGGDDGDDRTLWLVPAASPAEIAAIVDAAFTRRLGMPPDYRLRGRRER